MGTESDTNRAPEAAQGKTYSLLISEQHLQQTLPELLSALSGISHQAAKQAMDKGALWLSRDKNTRRVRRINTALKNQDTLHFYYNPDVLQQQILPATLIDDQESYSIWYKPGGMFCQGSKWADHCTIVRSVEKQLQRNTYLVHRLDRAAQGLIAVAHKKTTTTQLTRLFEQRQVDKVYRAIVEGTPYSEKQTVKQPVQEKAATSHIQLIESKQNHSLLEIKIETGRKHQIRQHLAHIGHPILGDRLYGSGSDETEDLQLYACYLGFICPNSGQEKSWQLPAPLQPKLTKS